MILKYCHFTAILGMKSVLGTLTILNWIFFFLGPQESKEIDV